MALRTHSNCSSDLPKILQQSLCVCEEGEANLQSKSNVLKIVYSFLNKQSKQKSPNSNNDEYYGVRHSLYKKKKKMKDTSQILS